MLKLKQWIENVWFSHRRLTKEMYTTGLIVFSGVVAVAVIMIGVSGYVTAQSVPRATLYETEEEEEAGALELKLITDDISEETSSSYYYVDYAIAMYEAAANEGPEELTEPAMQMMMEDIDDKELRSSGNVTETSSTLLSVRDYTALLKIVEAEATGEDLKGKVLIANVVLNRVASKRFPNSIYDVVHQTSDGRAQFSPIDDGRYFSVKVRQSTIEAVELALSGTDYSDGALFFVAKSLSSDTASSWFDKHLTFVFQYGVHSFYKY